MLIISSVLEDASRPLKALTEMKNADCKTHLGPNLPKRRYHGPSPSAEENHHQQELLRLVDRTRTNTRRSQSTIQWLSSYVPKSSDANGLTHVPKSLDELSHTPESSDVDASSRVFNSSDVDELAAVDESSDEQLF